MIYKVTKNGSLLLYFAIISRIDERVARPAKNIAKTSIKRVFTMQPFWRKKDKNADESQLVVAAKYGDQDAFAALVDRYSAGLYALAKRMVGNDRAEDVVQDAFLAAFKSLDKFRGDAKFSSYLHTITINRCKYILKREKLGLEINENSIEHSTSGAAESIANRLVLEQALAKLPTIFRECLTLRELAGFSYKEIAEILQISEGTVKSRLARARSKLKDSLIEMGFEP